MSLNVICAFKETSVLMFAPHICCLYGLFLYVKLLQAALMQQQQQYEHLQIEREAVQNLMQGTQQM